MRVLPLLVASVVWTVVSGQCEDYYTCASCADASGCTWCQSPGGNLCMPSGYSFYCSSPDIGGTAYTSSGSCPSLGPQCSDYSVNCNNCLVDALGAGLTCAWCTAPPGGLLEVRTCIPDRGVDSLCLDIPSGTEVTGTCPTECPEAPVSGNVIRVNPSSGVEDETCCCGKTVPCQSIRCALAEAARANAVTPTAFTILLENGVYYESDIIVPVIESGLTIKAENSRNAIIDANFVGRAFYLFDGHLANTELNGMVIRNGRAASGGGIFIKRASPTLRDVLVTGCSATSSFDGPTLSTREGEFGGGMYFALSRSLVEDCEIRDNGLHGELVSQFGAGVMVITSAVWMRRTVIADNIINSTLSGSGGGVQLEAPFATSGPDSLSTFENCTFSGNSVMAQYDSHGGGFGMSFVAAVKMTGCTFTSNYVTGYAAHGAGISVDTGALAVYNTVVEYNIADAGAGAYTTGGGINMVYTGDVHGQSTGLWDVDVRFNEAIGGDGSWTRTALAHGGGLYIRAPLQYGFPIIRTTFTSNTASGLEEAAGGGVFLRQLGAIFEDTVFDGNVVTSRCGMARGGATYIQTPPFNDPTKITGSSFIGNTARSTWGFCYGSEVITGGGALFFATGCAPIISDCIFRQNSVNDRATTLSVGGTIVFSGSPGATIPTMTRCSFVDNSATVSKSLVGGCIAILDSFVVRIEDCEFLDNVAGGSEGPSQFFAGGGAIACSGGSLYGKNLVIRRNGMLGNRVGGGGIVSVSLQGIVMTIELENVIVEDNFIAARSTESLGCLGGGLALGTAKGFLKNVTVIGNTASSTGGDVCKGAGVAVLGGDGVPFFFENVYITGNVGQLPPLGGGGGLTMLGGSVHLVQSRICGNTETQVACEVKCEITGNSGFVFDGDETTPIPTNTCPTSDPSDCTSFCSGHGSCNHDVCSCDPGYFGVDCSQECNGGQPMCGGHGTCSNAPDGDGSCDCEPGFYGRVTPDAPGLGCGQMCPKNCSYAVGGGVCDDGEDGSGTCTCSELYFGTDCSQECAGIIVDPGTGERVACFAQGTCAKTATSGECVCAGNHVPPCLNCLPGYFGFGCVQECKGNRICSGHGECDDGKTGSGKCTCEAGFYGLGCENECPGGADNMCYGHGECDAGAGGTGVCTCVSPGYAGSPDCEECVGYYGPSCDQQCPGLDGEACGGESRGACSDGIGGNGTCECFPGIVGVNCTSECPGFVPGVAITEICSGHGICTADATCACLGGFSGLACQVEGSASRLLEGEGEGGGNIGGAVAVGILLPLLILGIAGAVFYIWFNQLFCFAAYVDDDGATAKHVSGEDGQMKTYVNRLLNQRNTRHIGSGGAADVYKCKLDNGTWAAIKKLKKRTPLEMEEFHRELTILSSFVASEGHENVIALLFFCEDPPCIAMDLCEGGSVASVIHSNKKVSEKEKLGYVRDTATGMHFLHENQIAHLDLKPDNCLLTKDGVLKISDFGISKTGATNDDTDRAVAVNGTVQYMAPERFTGKGFDPYPADVFSFGIMMWAVWMRKRPYNEDGKTLTTRLMSGEKVERPHAIENCGRMYNDLMSTSWDQQPEQRPTFNEILTGLDNLYSDNSLDSFMGPRPQRESRMGSNSSEPNLDSMADLNSAPLPF